MLRAPPESNFLLTLLPCAEENVFLVHRIVCLIFCRGQNDQELGAGRVSQFLFVASSCLREVSLIIKIRAACDVRVGHTRTLSCSAPLANQYTHILLSATRSSSVRRAGHSIFPAHLGDHCTSTSNSNAPVSNTGCHIARYRHTGMPSK